MADYKFYALFTANKVGKAGITVTIDVYKSADDSLVVNNAAVNEIAGGLYSYVYQTASADDYVAIFKTADTTVDQQHVPALATKETINASQTGEYTAAIAAVADAVLDEAVVGSYTLRQLVKVMAAALAGKLSGGGTTTLTFRGVDDASDVIVTTVDANKNRTNVTLTV